MINGTKFLLCKIVSFVAIARQSATIVNPLKMGIICSLLIDDQSLTSELSRSSDSHC